MLTLYLKYVWTRVRISPPPPLFQLWELIHKID